MKFVATDLRVLRFSLLFAVLMIALGLGSVYFAFSTARSAQTDLARIQAQRNDYRHKFQLANREEEEIKQKSAAFYQLKARGVIGEEQRLEWVELLKEIRDKRRLIDLRYEIEPQRVLDDAQGSGFGFYASSMRIQLKPLHEEDLLHLIDDLRQQAWVLIQVRHCLLTRQPRERLTNDSLAQLQAECRIDWVTLREIDPHGQTTGKRP